MDLKQCNICFPQEVFFATDGVEELKLICRSKKIQSICIFVDKGALTNHTVQKLVNKIKGLVRCCKVIEDLAIEPTSDDLHSLFQVVKTDYFELIIAIGGGSVIDQAKFIAAAYTNSGYIDCLKDVQRLQNPPIILVAIPTTAGTGAEATANAVVLFSEKNLKVGISHPNFMPTYVVLNPQLTVGLPLNVTVSTGIDALCHALESYISRKNNALCELFAIKALEMIADNILLVAENGENLEARANMMLAAFYAGICLSTSSTVAVHALSYPLGGKFRITHGLSNAILLPYVMQKNLPAVQNKFAYIASKVLHEHYNSEKDGAKALVEWLFSLNKKLQIPTDLIKFGIVRSDVPWLAEQALGVKRLLDQNPVELTLEDISQIYLELIPE